MNAQLFGQIQGRAHIGEFLDGAVLQDRDEIRVQKVFENAVVHVFVGRAEVGHQLVFRAGEGDGRRRGYDSVITIVW